MNPFRLLVGVAALALLGLAPSGSATAVPPACPVVTATANADGTVDLSWPAVAGADGYNVYRNHDPRSAPDAQADLLFQGHITATTYHGAGLSAGVTYTFQVLATTLDQESQDCPMVEVTAVPDIPLGLVGVALAGGMGAFILARRR